MFELMRAFTTSNGKVIDPLDRVWGDMARPALGWAAEVNAPAADILETANEIVVQLDLPGHKAEDIQIKVENDILSVQSERKLDGGRQAETYHRSERSYGKFLRTFALPATVDSGRTVASYEAGVLQITLPKREDARPRTIQVNAK
jgi:HSP20 family protein